MNKISFIIIFTLIQIKSLTNGKPLESVIDQEKFIKFYKFELHKMAENFSEKAKNISKNLLKDKDILNEAGPKEIKEVRNFLQDFLQDYPHLKRFKLYDLVLRIFDNVLNPEYDGSYHQLMRQHLVVIVEEKLVQEIAIDHSKDFKLFVQNVLQDYPHLKLLKQLEPLKGFYEDHSKDLYDFGFEKMMQHYYGNIWREYERDFRQFIKQKFLPKFQETKQDLMPQDEELQAKLLQNLENLQKYQDYKSLKNNFNSLTKIINTSPNGPIKENIEFLEQINILENILVVDILKSILQDQLISEFTPEYGRNLTRNLHKYIEDFNSQTNILEYVKGDPISQLKSYYYDEFSFVDWMLIGKLTRNHYVDLLKSRFHLEIRYVINKLLEMALPSECELDIPQEQEALIQTPKIIMDRNEGDLENFDKLFNEKYLKNY